jgi:hypothetical protein
MARASIRSANDRKRDRLFRVLLDLGVDKSVSEYVAWKLPSANQAGHLATELVGAIESPTQYQRAVQKVASVLRQTKTNRDDIDIFDVVRYSGNHDRIIDELDGDRLTAFVLKTIDAIRIGRGTGTAWVQATIRDVMKRFGYDLTNPTIDTVIVEGVLRDGNDTLNGLTKEEMEDAIIVAIGMVRDNLEMAKRIARTVGLS